VIAQPAHGSGKGADVEQVREERGPPTAAGLRGVWEPWRTSAGGGLCRVVFRHADG
jgi:hypothetical protein